MLVGQSICKYQRSIIKIAEAFLYSRIEEVEKVLNEGGCPFYFLEIDSFDISENSETWSRFFYAFINAKVCVCSNNDNNHNERGNLIIEHHKSII